MSVVLATTTLQPEHTPAVREAVLATVALEGELTGAPQLQALTALPTGDGTEGGLQTQL